MMRHSPHDCWIFDIDGVLTSPQEKKIVNQFLFDQFITWLQNQNPIALNTGRSLEWVYQQVLTPLKRHIAAKNLSPNILHNLIAVGEKGADWLTYDKQG